ncbi:MAG: putative peptidoglycan glycosyltransferase FtsW [Clostridia bacterium]|nr:putative peptidoglycan glycosyltransferase FtsW [Clostridia bacterium]
MEKAKHQPRKIRQLFRGGFDLPFFVLVMVLLLFGLVMMFSASYAYAFYHNHDIFYYIKKQALFAVLGVIAMLIMANIDYHRLHKWAYVLLAASYVLLAIVLKMPKLNGCRRWIIVGPINFQPSEVAKFAVILVFAHFISIYYKKMKTFRFGVLPFVAVLGSIAFLMIKEPHLSGTILIVAIGFVLMLVGGTAIRWFVIGGSAAVSVLTIMVLFTNFVSYAKTRLVIWLNPFSDAQVKGWQIIQSLYAIGSGGLMGLGLGNSRQKYLYIAEPQNDYVYSIVCEELGFIGAAVVILLFVLLVWRGYVIAMRSPDKFGALLAVGLTTQVGLQAALNIAVVTNSVPNTGISLPFFSAGGSSLMMLLFQMGVVLSISRYSNVEKT